MTALMRRRILCWRCGIPISSNRAKTGLCRDCLESVTDEATTTSHTITTEKENHR